MDMTAEFLEDQFADYGDFDRIELGKIELTELLEEYASLKTKELEKQLQKEAMKQLSLLDQIKELEEENKLLLARIKQLEIDRDNSIINCIRWFFSSDYYTPVHNKPINFEEILYLINQH